MPKKKNYIYQYIYNQKTFELTIKEHEIIKNNIEKREFIVSDNKIISWTDIFDINIGFNRNITDIAEELIYRLGSTLRTNRSINLLSKLTDEDLDSLYHVIWKLFKERLKKCKDEIDYHKDEIKNLRKQLKSHEEYLKYSIETEKEFKITKTKLMSILKIKKVSDL